MRRFNWRTRHDFEFRLLATMMLTLLVIGVMQYVLTTRRDQTKAVG